MPTYVFESENGDRVERTFRMSEVPDSLDYQGVHYRRIIVLGSRPKVRRNYDGVASNSLPLNWPYAQRHDQRGRPVFRTRKEATEALVKANDHGEDLVWDN